MEHLCSEREADQRFRWSRRVVGLPGLEPGTSSLSGFCPAACSPRKRLATWATTHRLRPLETTGNRSAPMACGPNVDQGWRGGRVARSCPGRGSLRRFGPPQLAPTLDRIGWPGTTRPITALTGRSPACKARSGRIATCGASERCRSRPSWCGPWLSAGTSHVCCEWARLWHSRRERRCSRLAATPPARP